MRSVIYEVKPQRKSMRAATLLLLLLPLVAIAFGAASLFAAYRAILQCVGLLLLIPVIRILARYFLVQYLYRLCVREDGVIDLEVFTFRGGSRMQLVCRVGVDELTAVLPLTEENEKPPHGVRRFNYHPDMAPREGLLLSVKNGDGTCEILLANESELYRLLTRG